MAFKRWLSGAPRGLAAFVVVASLHSHGRAQAVGCPCEPSPKVKAALERLSSADEQGDKPHEAFYHRRLQRLQALLKQHPSDPFVHRRYQTVVLADSENSDARPRLIAEYQAWAEREPHNPVAQYLYACALGPQQWEAAAAVGERALATAPTCPQLHLLMTKLYQYRDKERARRHLSEFMRLCPNSLAGYAYASLITDPTELQTTAERLRARLRKAQDREAAAAYVQLWRIEFRARTVAEHAQLRRMIQSDLQRLRAQHRVVDEPWLRTLYEGYGYISDEDGRRWVEAQLEQFFPYSKWRWEILDKRWQAEHPYPDASATPEQLQSYYRALLQHTEQKIRVLPDDFYARLQHFEALAMLPDSPDAQVLRAADALLRVLDRPSEVVYAVPPIQMRIARQYAKRKLRLDQIPGLIQAGLRQLERHGESQAATPEMKKIFENNMALAREEGWSLLFDLYLEMQRYDQARDILTEMRAALTPGREASEPAVGGSSPVWKVRLERLFWEWSGRLAEAEGRKLDAIVFYQRAGRPEKAQTLWSAAGGTEDGWKAFGLSHLPSPPKTPPPAPATIGWMKRDTPLPDFTLSDLGGRTWKLADLRGKTALINIWATWCGPCKQELPHIQKLYERVKNRQDVVILSFNVDEDVGLIEPFVKKQGYTFPVVPAKAYVEQVVPQLSIPRNWLISPDGVLHMEQLGFRLPGEQWINQVIEMMERARSGRNQSKDGDAETVIK